MACCNSSTLRKTPRRTVFCSSSANLRSLRLSQLELVGMKWSTNRGRLRSQVRTRACPVQAERRRKFAVEATQEAQELLMAMTRVVLGDYPALADMQRGKKAGRAMPFIIVGESPAAASLQRQARLRTI